MFSLLMRVALNACILANIISMAMAQPEGACLYQTEGAANLDSSYKQRCEKDYLQDPDFFNGYKSHIINQKMLMAFPSAFPGQVEVFEIGRSLRGHPILSLKISRPTSTNHPAPSILINCGHHPMELAAIEYCYEIARFLLADEKGRRWTEIFDFVIVPILNPDGAENYWHLDKETGRKNARPSDVERGWRPGEGVDLNRNYPFKWGEVTGGSSADPAHSMYRGSAPASEPETRAMMALANSEDFIFSLSFHTAAGVILTPYSIPGPKNPQPDLARVLANTLANYAATGNSQKPKYKVQKNLYPVDGTDQDWHLFAHGTLALLVEGPFTNPSYKVARAVTQNFIPGLEKGLEQLTNNMSILALQVSGDNLNATQVEVSCDGVTYLEGERFHPRARDMVKFFVLPAGSITTCLVQTMSGLQSEVKKIFHLKAGLNWEQIDF